jgi:APA family basic amino acid/polyamine antiporter
MSCDELFHRRASRVNRRHANGNALHQHVAAVLFIMSATFSQILAALAFFFANYSMGYISVIVLRFREPDLPRPYRAWVIPDHFSSARRLNCLSGGRDYQ